jgi:PD-(D/E)XK nuclease superfamily
VDALTFGNLVHELLRRAVDALEPAGGISRAEPTQVELTVERVLNDIAREWETDQPIPPPIIWRSTLQRARQMSLAALAHPFTRLKGQTSWTEIPFGTDAGGRRLPWDGTRAVEIPGSGIRIQGYIDRLDIAGDMKRARVIDYKTGRLNRNMADVVVKGGGELQRCLYAFAVKTLLGTGMKVEAALLYPGAPQDEQALFPLSDVDAVLDRLAAAIRLARRKILDGTALPGVDADNQFNDFAFAFPASPVYLPRKMPLAKEQLGRAARIWDDP